MTESAADLDALAPQYARVVLENLHRPFPYATHHVESEGEDTRPATLHPAFCTSFDWHSCVHMHVLACLLLDHDAATGALGEDLRGRLLAVLAENLTAEKLRAEADYLERFPAWERPYGWGWLVRLAAETAELDADGAREWAEALLAPVRVVVGLARDWAGLIEHPVRHGVHINSAFGIELIVSALDRLVAAGFSEFAEDAAALRRAALRLFGEDRGWPIEWEISGQDFLSAGLAEAALMARVLDDDEFPVWFEGFLPGLASRAEALVVTRVPDESDGYMAHLNGLNLSRAQQLYRVLGVLGPASGASTDAQALRARADELLAAGLDSAVSEEYMSSHWLATFAWLAILEREALEG